MKSAKAIFFDFEVFKYDWLVCITEYWLDENKNIKTKDLVILNNRIQLIDYYRNNKSFAHTKEIIKITAFSQVKIVLDMITE